MFHRRHDEHLNFSRTWNEYRSGFGDPAVGHWLGNENIRRIIGQRSYELRIDMEDGNGTKLFAKYSSFLIGEEMTSYQLDVSGYEGNAGTYAEEASTLSLKRTL